MSRFAVGWVLVRFSEYEKGSAGECIGKEDLRGRRR